ncbi:MAG: DUF3325 domain-containing protein [Pseudomonadota bacterium]|nr:DUF3325 domain-containing protein [Pseudomonadota bacterium]
MDKMIWLALALCAAVFGMVWLSLSLNNHWKQVFAGQGTPHQRRLRTFGWGALLCSALFCVLADNLSMAALVWIMLLPLSAVLVSSTLTWRPHWLKILCPPFMHARP